MGYGYKPDTQDLNEVDEPEVQIGRQITDPIPHDSLRPDYTGKYSSVMITGLSKEAEEKDVYDILLEAGLPDTYNISDIKKHDKNGQLLI